MILYEPIDHTADAGFLVRGATLPALFENAARCLLEAVSEVSDVAAAESREVALEGGDLPGLFRVWLSELLYLSYVKHLVLAHASVVSLTDTRLVARVSGEAYDEGRHERHPEIKAVTWHDLSVTRREDHWEAVFILDL